MIWFYERDGEQLRCEVLTAAEGQGYELIITEPDGSQRIERFDSSAELTRRQLELEQELLNDGWHGPHGRYY